LIEPALNQNISTRTQNILTEYLKSLSQPSIDEEADGHKQKLIMALGNEERKLLSSFWDKNQKLILSALYAISNDPNQDIDTRDSITDALDKISEGRDKSTYQLNYNGVTFISNVKKSDIGLQTVKLLYENNLITPEIIEFLKSDRSCSFPLIKKTDESLNNLSEAKKYRIGGIAELNYNNVEYYVARNWGKENTEKFITRFTEKFTGLTYETDN